MSHIVTITTQVRDADALRLACTRLKLEPPVEKTVRLFSTEVTGHAVQLPDWRYSVVFALPTGAVHFDNYEDRWGDQVELNRLMQSYAVEKATLESHRQGHSVVEHQLADGSIKLTIGVGGAA